MSILPPTPQSLDSNNSIENNNKNNLQNNSEEKNPDENTRDQKRTHDPRMFERMWDEAKQGIDPSADPDDPRQDPDFFYEEFNRDESQDKNSKEEKPVREYKGSNVKLSGLQRIQSQKQKKYDRLVNEIKDLRAILKRGYKIKVKPDGQVNHIKISSSENEVISYKISDKDFERFMLRFEIADLDQEIKKLASRKRNHRITKKKKVAKSKQEDNLVERVNKELIRASKNGDREIVNKIQNLAQSGNVNEAHDSLKFFLSEKVKTVAKKLDKSAEQEKNVLERVLGKFTQGQS